MTRLQAAHLVADELERALERFPPMRSPHEGLAILEEEVDELKAEVRHGTRARIRAEATQVAAMAMRFLIDICEADAREADEADE